MLLDTKQEGISVLKNPFSENNIEEIHMHIYRADGSIRIRDTYKGTINFKNGNTKGSQSFDCNSFDELVGEIKAFIQSLNIKPN